MRRSPGRRSPGRCAAPSPDCGQFSAARRAWGGTFLRWPGRP